MSIPLTRARKRGSTRKLPRQTTKPLGVPAVVPDSLIVIGQIDVCVTFIGASDKEKALIAELLPGGYVPVFDASPDAPPVNPVQVGEGYEVNQRMLSSATEFADYIRSTISIS